MLRALSVVTDVFQWEKMKKEMLLRNVNILMHMRRYMKFISCLTLQYQHTITVSMHRQFKDKMFHSSTLLFFLFLMVFCSLMAKEPGEKVDSKAQMAAPPLTLQPTALLDR